MTAFGHYRYTRHTYRGHSVIDVETLEVDDQALLRYVGTTGRLGFLTLLNKWNAISAAQHNSGQQINLYLYHEAV